MSDSPNRPPDWRSRADRFRLVLLGAGSYACESVAFDVQVVNVTTGAVVTRSGGGRSRTPSIGASAQRRAPPYLQQKTEHACRLCATSERSRHTYDGLPPIITCRDRAAALYVPCHHSLCLDFGLDMPKGGADMPSISDLLSMHAFRYSDAISAKCPMIWRHRRAGPVDKGLVRSICVLPLLSTRRCSHTSPGRVAGSAGALAPASRPLWVKGPSQAPLG
jgi:hypothetical protein